MVVSSICTWISHLENGFKQGCNMTFFSIKETQVMYHLIVNSLLKNLPTLVQIKFGIIMPLNESEFNNVAGWQGY